MTVRGIERVWRGCPSCDNRGFREVGRDFFGARIMKCHSCGWEWRARRGDLPQSSKKPARKLNGRQGFVIIDEVAE